MTRTGSKHEPPSAGLSVEESRRAPTYDAIVDVLNQRWTLMVITQLFAGPKRFNSLAKSTKINPNTLRERLRELEIAGFVRREVQSTMPPRVEYRLSERGQDIGVILNQLENWLAKFQAVVVDSGNLLHKDD